MSTSNTKEDSSNNMSGTKMGPGTLSTESSTNKIRPWKNARTASTANVQKSKSLNTSWDKRQVERKREDAIKALEKEMKDEKKAGIEQRRTALKERKERQEEKKRLAEAAAKMSAKKLQRMKKRLGRSKKVAQ